MEKKIDKKYVETPLMKQYYAIKAVHPDAILLFRVGDFYETFGDDAIRASGILGITLTRRANGSASYVELAGFPYHAIDTYLPKLVRAGERVAICEQLEDPKLVKGLVKRGVIELVTPGVVLGDTAASSKNAAMGVVAGRIAASAVQRKISRVRDGALQPLTFYVGAEPAELADLETINDKGYITFRTFVGKAGYFITDDNLATTPEDDYRALTNRRVIDKAYRIAYAQLVEWLNDEVPVSKSGTLVPAWCSTVEADVEQAIETQMTAQGNLGNDPSDSSDTGVECKIDYDQNILATSQVKIGLRVKPNGYAKYIDVELGFKTA